MSDSAANPSARLAGPLSPFHGDDKLREFARLAEEALEQCYADLAGAMSYLLLTNDWRLEDVLLAVEEQHHLLDRLTWEGVIPIARTPHNYGERAAWLLANAANLQAAVYRTDVAKYLELHEMRYAFLPPRH